MTPHVVMPYTRVNKTLGVPPILSSGSSLASSSASIASTCVYLASCPSSHRATHTAPGRIQAARSQHRALGGYPSRRCGVQGMQTPQVRTNTTHTVNWPQLTNHLPAHLSSFIPFLYYSPSTLANVSIGFDDCMHVSVSISALHLPSDVEISRCAWLSFLLVSHFLHCLLLPIWGSSLRARLFRGSTEECRLSVSRPQVRKVCPRIMMNLDKFTCCMGGVSPLACQRALTWDRIEFGYKIAADVAAGSFFIIDISKLVEPCQLSMSMAKPKAQWSENVRSFRKFGTGFQPMLRRRSCLMSHEHHCCTPQESRS